MKNNLECIDTYFWICNRNELPNKSKVEKINRAWAEGHAVILVIYETFGGGRLLEIRTVNNFNQIGRDTLDITSKWKLYAPKLRKGQFPADWEHLI